MIKSFKSITKMIFKIQIKKRCMPSKTLFKNVFAAYLHLDILKNTHKKKNKISLEMTKMSMKLP